ncbi:MAG: VCBS domain-containing protein [Cypionkella sp.]|nr:VCBS domain-containing protein [Cypionkella sp.]
MTLDLASLGDDVDSDDDGSTLTYTISGAPAVGTASISGTTLTFNGGAGLDGLAQGEELVTSITITATDAHGATATSTVEVTITGTNDAPTLTAAVLGAVEDGPAVTLDLASVGQMMWIAMTMAAP